MAKVNELSSAETFSKKAQEVFKEKSNEVINSFRQSIREVFTKEEREQINKMPADYKILLLKAVDGVNQSMSQLKKDYGVNTFTAANPSGDVMNCRKEFADVTAKLLKNDFRSEAEYQGMLRRRLELSSLLAKQNNGGL
jgi:hypothetical protein